MHCKKCKKVSPITFYKKSRLPSFCMLGISFNIWGLCKSYVLKNRCKGINIFSSVLTTSFHKKDNRKIKLN